MKGNYTPYAPPSTRKKKKIGGLLRRGIMLGTAYYREGGHCYATQR